MEWKQQSEHVVIVELTSPGYAFFVHLTHASEFTHFSDNYFDLAPGETRTVKVWNEAGALSAEELKLAWR
jgi:hypothetical protein